MFEAEKRLSYLLRKFNKNEKYNEDYITFIFEIISKVYAVKLAKEPLFYHRGVCCANKLREIRVAFDIHAEHKGKF